MTTYGLPRLRFIYRRFLKPLGNGRQRRKSLYAALAVCLFLYLLHTAFQDTRDENLRCPGNAIADDVLFTLRTGATEAREKLPAHVDTILRCVPNSVIFSDLEETIHGYRLHDVLDEVSNDIENSPDFELYRRLHSIRMEDVSVERHSGSGTHGSLENPAWKIDKYKFLPMINKAFRHRPHAKWYVFAELDTYTMWGNLLEYLSQFDEKKSHYIGKHMYIGEVLFAHGGSGFVLSNPAMVKVIEQWGSRKDEYDKYTVEQWAGDMILGKVLQDAQIPLLWAFPNFQGDPVSLLDHNISKIERRPWCYVPLTYHHMPQDEIRNLWKFEQKWRRTHTEMLRHSDVFKHYILQQLKEEMIGWDNYSVDQPYSKETLVESRKKIQQNPDSSPSSCRLACSSKTTCLQYSYVKGSCSLSSHVRLGHKSTKQCLEYSNAAAGCEKRYESDASLEDGGPVHSGWMLDRVQNYIEEMDLGCNVDSMDWVT